MEKHTLEWADYLVIAATMCISIGIGLYYRFSGGRQKTIQEYFSGNKSMGIIPMGIALMVSFLSSISILGGSAESYTYGTQFSIINLSYLVGTPFVCYLFLPVFYNLGAISAYEYLEKRFGYGARLTASFIYWIQLLLYLGVVLYAPALALEATTGLSRVWSIVSIGLVCSFYSTIGGMKAVLITDVFQGFLMFACVAIIIGMAAAEAGGLSEIWHIASEAGRIEFDNVSLDPTVRHTWWGLVFGGIFTYLSLYAVNQVQVQRMMSLKNIKSARLALWLSWPILAALSFMTCFSGLAIYSKYRDCDPLATKKISSPDMLMPFYVMDTMSKFQGLPGLFIAGIFCAGLSTISAGLNSLAAVTLEDYMKPMYTWYTGYELAESKSIVFSKFLVLTFGIATIALAFAAQLLGGVLQASLTIFGAVGGPILGCFTLGMLTETANQAGAITGTLVSIIITLWIAFGQPRPKPHPLDVSTSCNNTNFLSTLASTSTSELLMSHKSSSDDSSYFYLYRISYTWYSAIGFTIAFGIGLLVSYVVRRVRKNYNHQFDPDLFFPFIANRIKKRRHRKIEKFVTDTSI